jgi:carbon-monoxide dehydrogenase medium subunit
MITAAFEYIKPNTLSDALHLLRFHGDGAKLLAGGHSLIPMMKLRLAQPAVLIDISGLADLTGISVSGGRVTVGALTTHAALAASDELRRHAPALWDAANNLGDPQVRNRGTAGGACAHGDPASDYPAVMLALDATFTLAGEHGERTVAAADFFLGMFETALGPTEILTAISFAAQPHSAYCKLEHPASHYALVGAAASLELDGGRIRSARVALSGVGDVACRAREVETGLSNADPRDPDAISAACAAAAGGADVRSDVAASADYRSAMADVYAARAVTLAASR